MDRAFAFYTEVLGGTEVMRDGDFHGEKIHNTLLADQEIEARARQVNPRTVGVPDLSGGAQRLDVRFVQFDNMVLELLQYRDADQPEGKGASFAEPVHHMSPAFPRMMHICFHIREDVDFNTFIADLEAESAKRGMAQVRANRVIAVRTEQERRKAPVGANSNGITEGKSNGWRLTGNGTIASEGPTRLPEARRAVQAGKLPRKMGFTLVRHDQQHELAFHAETLAVGGCKMPDLAEDVTAARAKLEERATQVRELVETLDLLYARFLTVRLSGDWAAELERVRRWPSQPETRAA
jgi:catechol 2,3-dioxygenase-like lactoylglutathione lyase family enzyme